MLEMTIIETIGISTINEKLVEQKTLKYFMYKLVKVCISSGTAPRMQQ